MAKEAFIPKTFRDSSIRTIAQAELIIEEYMAKGFKLTLRQLFYQFVGRDYIQNNKRSYDRLGQIINDARLAGFIDWDAIEDRTRNLHTLPHWTDPHHAVRSIHRWYRIDRWVTQPNYVEVWVEKEALSGIMARVCDQLDVPFFACRGYVSQSEQYSAGKRLAREAQERPDGEVVVFHFGDHDPSGIDMTRDNLERLEMFSGDRVTLERVALNMDQVERYSPPPNFAKVTDSRYERYVRDFGDESWELDALDPDVLAEMVRNSVNPLIDDNAWADTKNQEIRDLELLANVASRWEDVEKLVK